MAHPESSVLFWDSGRIRNDKRRSVRMGRVHREKFSHDEKPTLRAESGNSSQIETVARRLCYFLTGTRQRNSSKKFSRNTTS